MATLQTPGIYLQDFPATRSIQEASTSVAAFVGVTESGPVATPTRITSWNDYTRQFGGLAWHGYVSWAVFEFFNEGGQACYVVRAADTAHGVAARAAIGPVAVTAITPGSWGNLLKIAVTDGNGPSPDFDVRVVVDAALIDAILAPAPPADPSLRILQDFVVTNHLPRTAICGGDYYVLETFDGVTAADLDVPQGAADSGFTARVKACSMFIRAVPSGTTRPGHAVTALSAGTPTCHDLPAGVQALQGTPEVSLLALPDTVAAGEAGGRAGHQQQAALIQASLAWCESRQSLFYAVDPPHGLDPREVVRFKTGSETGSQGNTTALQSSYGAMYYPWIVVQHPVTGAHVPVPPSGAVLGRYVHTDLQRGVFKSPAGLTDGALRTATALATQVTDGDQDLMNPQGVNAIREMRNYGPLIWGARTLALHSDWTHIAVRRLCIHVEQSLKQSLQWLVFEPSEPALWAVVTRDIDAFLRSLWQQGALFGATPAEAFFVTCDARNNPPDARRLGELQVDIGLAPVYRGEFLTLRISQQTAVSGAQA